MILNITTSRVVMPPKLASSEKEGGQRVSGACSNSIEFSPPPWANLNLLSELCHSCSEPAAFSKQLNLSVAFLCEHTTSMCSLLSSSYSEGSIKWSGPLEALKCIYCILMPSSTPSDNIKSPPLSFSSLL